MVARYGCVQKNCRNNMLTARVSSLTDRFILWLEATYEPEFWFSFFFKWGWGKINFENSQVSITNIIEIICRILLPAAPG